MSKLIHGYGTRRKLEAAQRSLKVAYRLVSHLEFIVSQAPFVMLPDGTDALLRLSKSQTAYAYVNPFSWLKLNNRPLDLRDLKPFYNLGKSPTKFVMCARLPEGVIIFTPNKMPDVEGI